MDRAAIPEQVDGTPQMAEQVLEEGVDVEAAEIARATPEIERYAPPLGRNRQSATNREAIVTVAMADAGSLPLGRPSPADVGDEQESALIDEHEMGATSSGIFIRGHSSRFHRAMAASSRSMARRSGKRQDSI